MPKLSRWFIKTGMLCLLTGLLLGIIMALPVEKGSYLSGLYPEFVHLLAFGWITEIIFGVAFWMFPRYTKEHPRGNEFIGWVTYVLLNIGLVLRIAFEPMADANRIGPWVVAGLLIAALMQWSAGVLFVINTWKRVSTRRR